nr:hypothetical protein Iba_chr12eCG17030 [Ipomoea batatas]
MPLRSASPPLLPNFYHHRFSSNRLPLPPCFFDSVHGQRATAVAPEEHTGVVWWTEASLTNEDQSPPGPLAGDEPWLFARNSDTAIALESNILCAEGITSATEDGEKGAYTSCGVHIPGGSDAYRKTRGERGGDVHRDGAEPMRECDHIGDAADGGMLQ